MPSKDQEKKKAIALRKEGRTYNEILKEVPVAKSTLSLWLREVGLSKKQKQRITRKKRIAQRLGGLVRKRDRLQRSKEIITLSKSQVGSISKRELLLIGTALYWAEGSKEKSYNPSVRLDFANSDPQMIRFYMRWLREILEVSDTDVTLILHVHDNRREDIKRFQSYWLSVTNLPNSVLGSPVIKKHNPKTKRKNTGDTYKGLIAIRVKRSTMLNRKVAGWILGIYSART